MPTDNRDQDAFNVEFIGIDSPQSSHIRPNFHLWPGELQMRGPLHIQVLGLYLW